jgi:O-6-methylguanine DNA methyltransferase
MGKRKNNKKSFRERVFTVVRRIPKGKTMTYTDVAIRSGSPRAARAVGTILRTNYDSAIPCHRVIRADGTPGGYNRGSARKRRLLVSEGAL